MTIIHQAAVLLALFCIASAHSDKFASLSVRRVHHPVKMRPVEPRVSRSPAGYSAVAIELASSRVRQYKRADGTTFHVNVSTNLVSYYAQINMGTPPQPIDVVLDTGSATLAVPSSFCFGCSATSNYSTDISTSESAVTCDTPGCVRCTIGLDCFFNVTYGDGSSIQGSLFIDLMSVAPGLNATVAFGLIQTASQWENVLGGIMGLAYPAINCVPSCVLPAFDALVNTNHINNLFSMKLDPNTGGSIDFGGINNDSFVGVIQYTNVTDQSFYVVNIESLTVGGTPLTGDFGLTFVDSGTTFTRFPSSIFNQIRSLLLQCTNDFFSLLWQTSNGSPVCILADRVSLSNIIAGVPDIVVTFGGGVQLIWKAEFFVSQAVASDGTPLYCLGIISGTEGGPTIFGASFMQAYYVVFDRVANQVGFAYQNVTSLSTSCTPTPST